MFCARNTWEKRIARLADKVNVLHRAPSRHFHFQNKRQTHKRTNTQTNEQTNESKIFVKLTSNGTDKNQFPVRSFFFVFSLSYLLYFLKQLNSNSAEVLNRWSVINQFLIFFCVFDEKKRMRPLATLAWRRTSVSCFGRFDSSKRSCHNNPARASNILKSKFEDVPLSKSPYFDFLWMNHQQNGQRIALVSSQMQRRKFKKKSFIYRSITFPFKKNLMNIYILFRHHKKT